MENKAIVWKKSIYDNDFQCTVCGAELWKNGKPTDKLMVSGITAESPCFCSICHNLVAVIKPLPKNGYDVTEINGNQVAGEWTDDNLGS